MDIYEPLPLDLPLADNNIIKVIGVGGGGGNAVNHMFREGIRDVSFVVCNTDSQALISSPVPNKVQIGSGLGAGGKPEEACKIAEESMEKIQEMLDPATKMIFITAGMGGGTGTGASPVIAKTAYEQGILTVGIVTLPFAFEGSKKIKKALAGVDELSKYVDAILVINNEMLRKIYPDLELSNAFKKADDVLSNAAKAIAEIITVHGHVNTDFADVYNTLKDGKVAIMNTGYASGENRLENAIKDALNSPLVYTNDVRGASKILLSMHCSRDKGIKMDEVEQVQAFMETIGEDFELIWGITYDDSLGDEVKITLIATGYEVSDIPGMPIKIKGDVSTSHIQTKPISVNLIDEEPEESSSNKIIEELYGSSVKKEAPLDIVNIDELDDSNLGTIEDIPAWKRHQR